MNIFSKYLNKWYNIRIYNLIIYNLQFFDPSNKVFGCLNIYLSSPLHIITLSHHHIITSSHHHIITSSHLHIITSKTFLYFFPVIKMMFYTLNDLIIFMPFPGYQYHIARLGQCTGCTNGFTPVNNG